MVNITLPKILQPFYCAELVRLGKDHDGGYLVNRLDIEKTNHLLSFGIGTDISFEKDFIGLNNCPLSAYDKEAKIYESDFFQDGRKLTTKNVGIVTDDDNQSFIDIIQSIDGMIFMKCDIEGFEYQIFDQLIENRKRFSGIVLEVHDIADYKYFNELTSFISKLGMPLIHTHLNNHSFYKHENDKYTPNVIELTFTSSDNIEFRRGLSLPHELDMRCKKEEIDFSVIF
jgi:hypothetical protein